MREKVRDKGRLEHILEAIEGIEEFSRSVYYRRHTEEQTHFLWLYKVC